MKKILSAILASAMIISSFAVTSFADGGAQVDCVNENAGDANGDSKVNAKDISFLLRAVSGGEAEYNNLGDVNRDGKISSKDISMLLKSYAGWENIFIGHKNVSEKTEEASCTAQGEHSYICENCKKTLRSETTPLVYHNIECGTCIMCHRDVDEILAEWIGDGRHYSVEEVEEILGGILDDYEDEDDDDWDDDDDDWDDDDDDEDWDYIEDYREHLEENGIDTSEMTEDDIIDAYWALFQRETVERYREMLTEEGTDCSKLTDDEIIARGQECEIRQTAAEYREEFSQYDFDLSGYTDEQIVDKYFEIGCAIRFKLMAEKNGITITETDVDVLNGYYEKYFEAYFTATMRMSLRLNGIDTAGMDEEEIYYAYSNLTPAEEDTGFEIDIKTVSESPYKFSIQTSQNAISLKLIFQKGIIGSEVNTEVTEEYYVTTDSPIEDDYDFTDVPKTVQDFIRTQISDGKTTFTASAVIDYTELINLMGEEGSEESEEGFECIKSLTAYRNGKLLSEEETEEEEVLVLVKALLLSSAYVMPTYLDLIMKADGARINAVDLALYVLPLE